MDDLNLEIKKCSLSDFGLIKDKFYKNIFYSSAISSSIFSKKAFKTLLQIFYSDNEKLKKFLKTDNILSEINDDLHRKIDSIILKIVENNPESFIKDKKFRIYALRYINLQNIEYNDNFLLIDNQIYLLRKQDNEFFSGAQNLDLINVFSDNYIKKKFLNTNESFLFEKDLFNNLLLYIRNEVGTIDDLLYTDLLKSPDKTESYVEILNEIIDKKLYLRKRKKTNPTSLTKTNAKEIFSDYLNNKHKTYFEDYCKDNGISIWSIRNDDFHEYIRHTYYYVNVGNYGNHTELINQFKNNSLGIKYYFKSSEELVQKICNDSKFDISKKLNSKKYTFATKKIINDYKSKIILFSKYNGVFYDHLLLMIDALIKKNISEKIIRTIISKFLNINAIYISEITIENEEKISYSMDFHTLSRLIHDTINTINNYKKIVKTNNILMLRSYLSLCNAFNYNTFNDIYSLNNKLNDFISNIHLLSKQKDRIFKNFNEFNQLLSEIEALKLKAELKSAEGIYSEESLNISKNMKSLKDYLRLINNLPSSFKEKPIFNEVFISNENIKVEILNHKNPIGLLGAFVGGVCIDGAGKNRKDQLNKNFMNLVIRNERQINLWGLLCEGTYNGEKIFVLNNLQGCVNSNNKEEVLKLIYEALSEFKKNNNIKNVYFKKLGFNSLNLSGEKAGLIELSLKKRIRLDFNDKDEFFYI